MPYTDYSPAPTIDVMGKAYKDLKKELDDLKKAKGDKKAIKELETKLTEKGKLIKKKLEDDIGGVEASFKDHATKVDSWLGECVGGLKQSLDAFKKFEAAPSPLGGSDYDMATYAAGYIKSILDIAKKDADEYGKSWFKYRGFNGTSAYDFDKSVINDFNGRVGKLMNSQKGLGAKIAKMESLITQGEALKLKAENAKKMGLKDIEDAQKEAKSAETETARLLDEMSNKAKVNIFNLRTNSTTLKNQAAAATIAPDLARTLGDVFANALSIQKELNQAWRTAEKLAKSARTSMDVNELKDVEVKKSLDAADNNVVEAKKIADEALTLMKQNVPNWAKIQKTAKTG